MRIEPQTHAHKIDLAVYLIIIEIYYFVIHKSLIDGFTLPMDRRVEWGVREVSQVSNRQNREPRRGGGCIAGAYARAEI